MRKHGFLRGKIALRIFLLFVVCALLPIIALTVASSTFVGRQVENHARERLQQTAKLAGMELMSRVTLVDRELRLFANILRETSRDPIGNESELLADLLEGHVVGVVLRTPFQSKVLLGGQSFEVRAAGIPLPSPPGRARLHVETLDSAAASVFLAVSLDEAHPVRGTLVAELAPSFMWSRADGLDISSTSDLFVVDSDTAMVFNSRRDAVAVDGLGSLEDTRSLRGDLSFEDLEGETVAGYWTLYLVPQYQYPRWTVVVAEPRHAALAPVMQVNRLLPLIVGFCLLFVALLSLIQIRRQLVPITSLQHFTKRVAESDFEARVEIDSGDEFEHLAESFNWMAARLGRQFRTLKVLAETDRTILSTFDESSIVRTVLSRMQLHLQCDCVAISLTKDAGPQLTTRLQWSDGPDESVTSTSMMTPEDRRALLNPSPGLLRFSGGKIPSHLSAMFRESVRECVVLPFVRQGVSGFMTIGYMKLATRDDEGLVEARRLANQLAVALSNARLVKRLESANWETLHALARAVDAVSPWTAGHSERVTSMTMKISRQLGLSGYELDVINKGALLHDIGKIGVPNFILDKPSELSDEEMGLMRDHVRIGARILEPITAYRSQIPMVLYHHEQYDGSGYPEGLAGKNIPFHARILAVADVYDALISRRPYREAWPFERVVAFIKSRAGSQFDPDIVDAFVRVIEAQEAEEEAAANETAGIEARA